MVYLFKITNNHNCYFYSNFSIIFMIEFLQDFANIIKNNPEIASVAILTSMLLFIVNFAVFFKLFKSFLKKKK